jgi:hypothetical protein
VSTPELRLGDVERESAVTALGEHYAAGRLTREEYDERSDRALRATTFTDLKPLFVDLPAPHPRVTQPTPQARGFWTPPPAASRAPVRRGPRMPVLPLVVAIFVLLVVLKAPWFIFIALCIFFFTRARRGC